jgi:hypothetical protein
MGSISACKRATPSVGKCHTATGVCWSLTRGISPSTNPKRLWSGKCSIGALQVYPPGRLPSASMIRKSRPKPAGAEWYTSSVRSSLRNIAYTGKQPTRKRQTVKRTHIDTPQGTKIREIRVPVAPDHWVWLEVPPIISQRVFDSAQAQLRKNQELSRRNMKQDYFLRGRWLKCARCGGAMAGYTLTNKYGRRYRYYSCANQCSTDKSKRCPGSIRFEEADGQVWHAVTNFLLTPGAALRHLEQNQDRHEGEREQSQRDQAAIQRALAECDADDAKWKHAYEGRDRCRRTTYLSCQHPRA